MAGEMCLSGRLVDGAEAHRVGLAERLAGADEVLDMALAVGEEVGANPAPQLRMIKSLLSENALEEDLVLVQAREHELMRECWKSPEHKQAVERFLKR